MKDLLKDKSILRYPRLDTMLMVEKFIRQHEGKFKKRKLWESLPKRMMYQTFCVIINYLLYSRKISIDSERKIGWIYYPELTRKYLKRKDLCRNETSIGNKVCGRKNKESFLRAGRR